MTSIKLNMAKIVVGGKTQADKIFQVYFGIPVLTF